jgi:uncharacterized SAM-binding protein YcdF (DUF218 family)
MTSESSRPTRPRSYRRLILCAIVLSLAAGLFLSLGYFVARIDPLQRADAIYVLGGTRIERAYEATRLYRQGYAPRIVLSRGSLELAAEQLERLGIHVPTDVEVARDLLVARLGVPAGAIMILPSPVDNTAQEAEAISSLAAAGHWTRIIVITARSASRRTGFAFRRVLGSAVQVIVTCSRDDDFEPAGWWRERWSFRETFYEAPKLVAYWLGLRG